jgi:hypothetical protein
MNQEKLINMINKNLKITIGSSFCLTQRDRFRYTINGTSSALSRYKNPQESVKVLGWFNNFWLFIEIKFKINEIVEIKRISKKSKLPINTQISLSVFQGDELDEKKNQLFRAEWDDYNNFEEKHAQPHWHITSSQEIENTFKEYAEVINASGFVNVFEEEKQRIFDVKKIHFAMNADWQNSGTFVYKIENEEQVVKWLQGMLRYLKTELEDKKLIFRKPV